MIRRERNELRPGIPPPASFIRSVMQEHQAHLPRLEKLHDYYALRTPILHRTRPEGLPNHQLTHAYARYIVAVSAGYLGKAVYTGGRNLPALLDAFSASDMDSLDAELARYQSLYGVGCELVYADEETCVRSCALDPRSAFVVYSADAACEPLCGIYYRPMADGLGRVREFAVTICTKSHLYEYRTPCLTQPSRYTAPHARPHYFGRVPLIEYWNNEEETGDFESVLSLMDAYDTLQSDRMNDQSQTVDALLVITGAQLMEDESGRSPAKQLRQDKILYLPDSDAKAEFLDRPVSGGDAEVLRKALQEDIHKFSMVPDLSDEQFAGNASGVALRYKLLALEQQTAVKERWFRQGLRERMRMWCKFLSLKGEKVPDPRDIALSFERTLPQDIAQIAQTVKTLEGIVPNEVLVGQLPFIDKEKGMAYERSRND